MLQLPFEFGFITYSLVFVLVMNFFHAVLFDYYDSNHDGMISHSEVADAMRVACGEDLSSSQLDKVMFKSPNRLLIAPFASQ